MVEDRHVEPQRFARQRLHHQSRGARAATRRAADLVVIGLIAQHAAESVERQRQAQELQRRQRARRTYRLDIGGAGVHRAAGGDGCGEGAEIVAVIGAVGRVQCLFVGAGAGGGSAPGALGGDDRLDAAPLHLHRRAQARRAAADDERVGAMHGQPEAAGVEEFARRAFRRQPRHDDVGECIEDRLRDRQGRFPGGVDGA